MAELVEVQGPALIYSTLRSDPLLFKDFLLEKEFPEQWMVLGVKQSKHTCKPAHEEPAENLQYCILFLFGCIHDHPLGEAETLSI